MHACPGCFCPSRQPDLLQAARVTVERLGRNRVAPRLLLCLQSMLETGSGRVVFGHSVRKRTLQSCLVLPLTAATSKFRDISAVPFR